MHCDSLPDLLTVAKSESLSEKVWEGSPSAKSNFRLLNKEGELEYNPAYISWLDAQGQHKRRRRYSAQVTGKKSLSQLMRAVGRKLDRVEAHGFSINWKPERVIIDYELSDGQRLSEEWNEAKLRELMIELRFRRAPQQER